MTSTLPGRIAPALTILACAAAILLPPFLSAYPLTLLNFIGLAAIPVSGLVLLTGIGGLTSFGQAAFVGIGAYATAFVTTRLGLSPWLGLAAAIAAAGLSAALIGTLTLRLSGHYLPLSTIAWSVSLNFLVGNLPALGGHDGMSALPPITLAGWKLGGFGYTWLIFAGVALSFVSVRNLLASRTGRAIRALRGRAIMAEAFGIHTARLKVLIFVHAAILAGMSGWLYAHLLQFVSQTPFGLGTGIEYLFMLVIGGATSLWGAIAGPAVLILLRDGLQDLLPLLVGSQGAVEDMAFGVLMVVVLQRARLGLAPFLARFIPVPAVTDVCSRTAPISPPSWPGLSGPPNPAPAATGDPDKPGHDAGEGRGVESVASWRGLPRRVQPVPGTPILAVRDVLRAFGGLIAVNTVSFELEAGRILGVIGPNGAGKSTLFNLLTGVLRPQRGSISLCGQPIERRPSREIAAMGVARTFQHVMLRSDMSALENVALGAHLRGSKGPLSAMLRLDRAEEASLFAEARLQMQRVGLGDYLHMPAGSLALGQQRILEIARALAADPLLLLLDEPAAGLRFHEKRQLAEVLDQLRAEGMTILIVEHDMEFVMNLVDRLVVMEFGSKIAEGLPADIQADTRVREAYLGVDA